MLILLYLFALAKSAFIEPITRTPLRPYSINEGYTTDYLLSLNIPTSISSNAFIEVEFPMPYQIPSACKAYVKPQDGSFTVYSCTKSSYSHYLVNIGEIVAGDYQIAFEGIENPSAYLASTNFKIRTYYNGDVLVDANEYLDAVPFLPAPTTSKNATIENLGYSNVNLGSKFNFQFSLKTALKGGDSIKFNFPVGFYFIKPACFHRNSGGYATAEVLHNNRMVICQGFPHDIAAEEWQVVTIIGVVNPEYSGYFTGFYLETLEKTTANVYEQVIVPGPVRINPGSITVDVRSASLLMTTNTTHIFDLLFEDDVKSDGQIWIKLPPGFRYLAPNCTLLRPIEAQVNKEVTCGLAANGTGYIIENFAGISASQSISVQITAENPPVSTSYKIQIFSYSTTYSAMIDEAYTDIAIDDNYGSSKFFKSHSLRFTRRLGYNETGPLEFTFFLNIPLPATYSTFEGKIVVDIRPQIPTPPVGTLACFFYNTVPAKSCTWDVSDPTKTTITIYTPETDPYYQTEIPITVTTEDAVGTYGVKLPELIQRYKFYFYFFRNGEVKEHEVYYEDYIPDPITMPDDTWVSTTFNPMQYGEDSFMQITWTNNYLALSQNYFIELEFDQSTTAWATNLGWTQVPWYGRYKIPCLVYGLGSGYHCLLNPGSDSGTATVYPSTIQILGLSTIALSNVATIMIPKVKFGTSPTGGVGASMKFTLYQNTPGESTLRIPIMLRQMTFQPSAAYSGGTNAFTTRTLTPNQPDVDSTLALAFTNSGGANPQYTIYQYPNLFVLATTNFTCGGSNMCYCFTDPVRWIVFVPSSGQGATTSTTLSTIHTPSYTGSYTFTAKSVLNQAVGNKVSSAITLLAGALTVTFTSSASNTEINTNSILKFNIGFTTITQLPADNSIILTFNGGLTVPTGDDFYCEIASGLTGLNAAGVVCALVTSTTNKIKLYNIAAVAANVAISLVVQMKTGASATSFTLGVVTYYERAATNTVDSGTSSSLTLSFSYDSFTSASIINDLSGQIVRAGGYGAMTFSITPGSTFTNGAIIITFPTGFGLSNTDDVLYCKLGTVRVRCTYTLSPLVVTISNLGTAYLIANTALTVTLTTDFSDNSVQGIKAPTTPGYYFITIALQNAGVARESLGQYFYVYANSIPQFQVSTTTTTASVFAFYTFTFVLKTALPSNTDATTRGRIFIEFPVPVSGEGFLADLGTGNSISGSAVGCIVTGLGASTVSCRLMNSPGNNLPAKIELTGFDAVTSVPTSTITVQVSRIKNPAQTLGEYVFGLRTETVTVLTGDITPIEYTIYKLWNLVSTNSVPTITSPYTASFQAGSYPGETGRTLAITMYQTVGLSSGDQIIYELPSSIVISSTLTCTTLPVSSCVSYPNIGWVVYVLNANVASGSNQDGTITSVTIPASLSSTGYTITAYIYKSGQLVQEVIHNIPATTSITGTFTSATATVDSSQLVMNRGDTEIVLSFVNDHQIPNTGSIEIRFPSGITPLDNCKSSPSTGSQLTSSTGRVACGIQSNSWVISNFDTFAASQTIQVYGTIVLPSSSGTTASIEIYSYSNLDPNLATNGNVIDKLTSGLTLTIGSYDTLALDVVPTTLINQPLIASATTTYRPLIIDFTLTAATVLSSQSIQVRVDGTGTAFSTGAVSTGGTLICFFTVISSGNQIACKVAPTTGTTLLFTLTPQETLSPSVAYRATITSVFANSGNDGIQMPTGASNYKIVLTAAGSVTETDFTYFEVLPKQFTSITVKNYVMSQSEEDVIDIDFTAPSSIATTDRVIIEFPTVFNSTNLFDTAIGKSLLDAQDNKCEVIASTPSLTGVSCVFQKGNTYAKTPATVIIYGFSAAFTRLRVCFTVVNPAVSASTALPITIYTLTGTSPTFTKTFYQKIEKGIVVRTTTSALTETGTPTFSTYAVAVSSNLNINLQFGSPLLSTDCYLIKTPALGVPSASSTTQTLGSFGSATVLYLPKNRLVVIQPTTASVAAGTYSVTISGFTNPANALGSPTLLTFTGYASHFSTFIAEKITYSNPSADFQGTGTFPTSPTVSLSTTSINYNAVMTITINAIFLTMRSVIINVPSQLALGADCYETTSSAIKVLQCTPDSTNRRLYITLEDNTFPSTAANLQISALVTNGGTVGAISNFDYYVYTVVNTDPTVVQGVGYSVTGVAPSPSSSLTTPSPNTIPPELLQVDYTTYLEYRDAYPTGSFGDLLFQFTLPDNFDSSYTISITLSSSLLIYTAENLGDVQAQPAVIVNSELITATYTAGVLSFSPVTTLSSGTSPVFRITQITRSGESIGLVIANPLTTTELPLTIEASQSGTAKYIGTLGTLYLKSTKYQAQLGSVWTRSPGAMNTWEFQFYLDATIDNLYIDFPTVDEYGNTIFDTTLGGLADKSSIACASTNVIASLSNPECIFFAGDTLQTKPARIWVRGILPPGVGTMMSLFIIGPQNPSVGTRLYINTRFYSGTTFAGLTRINAYDTTTAVGIATPAADDTNFPATADTLYGRGSATYTFYTGVTIPSGSILMVKLDPSCTTYSNTGSEYFAKGDLGTFVLQKTSAAISGSSGSPGPYTFSNFRCTKSLGTSFSGYHIADPVNGNGEIRPSNYNVDEPTRETYGTISTSLSSYELSGDAEGTSGVVGRFTFDLSGFATSLSISAGYLMEFTITDIVFQTLTSCNVLKGFTMITPNQPVTCTVDSTNSKIKIADFASIKGTSEPVEIQITFDSSSPFADGTIDIKVYSDSTHYTAGDFLAYSSISVLAPTPSWTGNTIPLSSLTFQTTPYPGLTGINTIQIGTGITVTPNFTPTDQDQVVINLGSLAILTSSTTSACTITSSDYGSCFADYANQQIVLVFANAAADITEIPSTDITLDNLQWPSEVGPYFLSVEITIAGTTTYKTINMPFQLTGTGGSGTIISGTPLHLAKSSPNEYHFELSVPIDLDSSMVFSVAYTNLVLRQSAFSQIDCLCSVPQTATCYAYDDGTEKSIDIIFSGTVTASTVIDCYVPDIQNSGSSEDLDARILTAMNRVPYFTTTLPTLTFTSFPTSSKHTLGITYPSAPITSSTTGQVTVTIDPQSFSYNAGSVVYVDFASTGPIFTSCSPLASCRYYNTVRNIYVTVLSSGESSSFNVVDESVSFSVPSVFGDSSYYVPYSFVSDENGQDITSWDTITSWASSNYATSQTAVSITPSLLTEGYDSLMKATFSSGSTIIPTGGALVLQVSGPTNVVPYCYASISNVALSCSATNPTTSSYYITITSSSAIPSSSSIEVLFTGTTPTTALTATLEGYSVYVSQASTSNIQVLANGAVTVPTLTSSGATNVIASSSMQMVSLVTKSINPTMAPFRLRFELTSALTSSGNVQITLPANQYSYTGSDFQCYFKTYSSELDYTAKISKVDTTTPTPSLTGTVTTGYTITASPSATLAANTVHELVCGVDGVTGFAMLSADNTKLTATFTDGSVLASGTIPLYKNQATPVLQLNNLYIGSEYTTNPNTVILQLTANANIAVFPTVATEIEFTSASSGFLKSGFTKTSRDLPCGIVGSSLSVRSGSTATLRCTLVQTSPPKVRIENYALISSGASFYLMLYDLDNSVLAQSFIDYMDIKVLVTNNALGTQSQHRARRLFTPAPSGVTTTSSSSNFPSSSVSTYSTQTTLTRTITWDGTTCTVGNCRLIIRGKNTDWKFKNSNFAFSIGGTAQTIQVDQVNNIMVVLSTTAGFTNGLSYTFVWSGTNMLTPSPTQINGGEWDVEYYSNLQPVKTYILSISYPSLSTAAFSGTPTSSCTSAFSQSTGVNGNVECTLSIPLNSAYTLSSFTVKFTNSASYASFLPYCEAYVSSGSATATYKQLICSRIDTSSTIAGIRISGFTFVTSSIITVKFRAKAKTASLATQISLEILSSGTYQTVSSTTSTTVSLSSVFSASINAPASLSASYYPTKLGISSTSPLRLALDVDSVLQNTGFVQITLGSSYSLPANTLAMCTLRSQTSFGVPYLTMCTYTSGSNLYLLQLMDSIPVDRYIIEITTFQYNAINAGTSFPSTYDRVSVLAQVNSGSTTILSIDKTNLVPQSPGFATISVVNQRNKIGGSVSQFELSLSVATAVLADTTSNENILVLEFPTSLYGTDLGASTTTFFADGNSYYNGVPMPSYINPSLGSNAVASLHYATGTGTYVRVVLSQHTGIPTSASVIDLAYIVNPAALKPFTMNVKVLTYESGKAYPKILYQASYVNYFTALTPIADTGNTLSLSFSPSNPAPQQSVTITMNKNYVTTVDTNSKVYVKLRNQANGFNYAAMTTISCGAGYTVQWHKAGYMFFLVPTSNLGATPTIVCSGFVVGSDITTITIETGIHQEGYQKIIASTQTQLITSYGNTADSGSSSRVTGSLTTRQSINLYRITYNPGSFIVKQGTYIQIQIPSGLAVITGETEKITFTGLTDSTTTSPTTAVSAYISGGNLRITGYAQFTATTITITFYLKNIASGTQTFSLRVYDKNDNLVSTSSTFTSSTIVATATYNFVAATYLTYLTDKVPVFATQIYPLTFQVVVKNALPSTSSTLSVTLPTGWTMTPNPICKYSTDSGSHWIQSSCPSGPTYTFSMVSGFYITAGATVLIQLTTDNSDYTLAGVTRPATSYNLQVFNVKSTLESTFVPFILYPVPPAAASQVTPTWYSLGTSDYTVIKMTLTTPVAINPSTDYFQIDFATYDDISQVFPNDLGSGTSDKSVIADCARDPSSTILSTNVNLGCYSTPGQTTTTPYTSVSMRIYPTNSVSTSGTVTFFIANAQNPAYGIPGGYVFNIMRQCRNDGYGCPLYRLRDYVSFGSSSPKITSAMGRPALQAGKTQLFQTSVTTTFSITLTTNILPTGGIVLKTPLTNMKLTTTCSSTVGTCMHFPRIGWSFFQPTAAIIAGNITFSMSLDNAFYYDRTNTVVFVLNTFSSSGIQQVITGSHPNYALMVPTLQTDATQTDQSNQYIVRNFDNILKLSMTGIWRTSLVQRIYVNIPSTYTAINSTYCMAGIHLDSSSDPLFLEFPCQVTGARQILIVIQETWAASDASETVVVYYRGFESLSQPTGNMAYSTITSYASLTTNWVIDENTQYTFYVNPTPTPIVRDLNINLKSMNDRKARIGDYVVFYAAIWPNTPLSTGLITQLLFQVDDEYIYPSLSNLVCITKAIFREQVTCTLKRRTGRTDIYVNTPTNYDNGPFLLTITNTAEDLLFIAPDREGSFLFNVSYLDAAGDVVETADSYMDISGEYVSSFSAEPITTDPLTPTLYNIQFNTTSRVTPQGFVEDDQTVSSKLILSFQTYTPAYPIDLGTGLADGSQISCIAASGMTVLQKKQLSCQLVLGTTTVHTQIIITEYDAIPANTIVQIFLDAIPTLDLSQTSRIGMQIYSTYTSSPDIDYVFYNALEVSPQVTTSSIANSASTLTVARSGSTTLRETSSYTFSFTTTVALNANSDYIVIEFPEYGYERNSDYSSVIVSITSPSTTSSAYIMPRTNAIYILVTQNLAAGAVTVSIQNLQNPSFDLSGTLQFTVTTIVTKKIRDIFTANVAFTSTLCTLFSNEEITYNSTFTLINENTYQISFTTAHIIQAQGSLAIVFDPNLYNLRPSNPTCELGDGFSSSATCSFELFSEQLVRISMNGVEISSGTQLTLSIINVNNPTDSTTAPIITIRSYFDAAFGTSEVVCSKDITLAKFKSNSLMKCPIQVQPEVDNAGVVTDYLVTISCPATIRDSTTIKIQFPPDYENLFPSTLTCTTNGNYMLSPCYLIDHTTQVSLLISQPNPLRPLIVRIRGIPNPSLSGTYNTFDVKISQYDVLYAQLDSTTSSTSITIGGNLNLVQLDDKLLLSIFPTNYGEKATYYFMLNQLNVKVSPDQLLLSFDSSFAQAIGPDLECGTFTPDEAFGNSFALNYEKIKNYKTFSCEVIDQYKLQLTLTTAFSILPNQPLDFFFFVKNVMNPSLNTQTDYSFDLLFTKAGSVVYSSSNVETIYFGLPPALLEVTSLVNSDTNILAPSNYTFTIQALSNLPETTSNVTKEYELLINLPMKNFPDYNKSLEVVYYFPENTAIQNESSAFNFFNSIYFAANYPDLASLESIQLMLSNMSNPVDESYCGLNAAGLPIKFDVQYVSRLQNAIYGRSYTIMDQQNCLQVGKARDSIKVVSPLYLRRGLRYNISLQVEENASGVNLTPLSTFLLFEPQNVTFTDYETRVVTLSVIVAKNCPKGDYTITWRKVEGGVIENYLEVEDTQVIVVDEAVSNGLTPLPKISISEIKYVWIEKEAREVVVTLDLAPAEELIIQISPIYTDSQVTGSVDGVTFTTFPISLSFTGGQISNTFYIYAKKDAKDNAMTYTLSGANAKAYNPKIPNTPYAIKTQYGLTDFQILSADVAQIFENKASYLVALSQIGTVYYLAVVDSIVEPTQAQIIAGTLSGIASRYYKSGSVEVTKLEYGSTISSFINVTGLDSQAAYKIYFAAKSAYGDYSGVEERSFTTLKVVEGVSLLIPCLGNVNVTYLIDILSVIIPVAKDRLFFAEAEQYALQNASQSNLVFGDQLSSYRIVLAPDASNNDPSPLDLGNGLLTDDKQTELENNIPQFYKKAGITITPVKRLSPRVIVTPQVGNVGYYSAIVNVELIEVGRLFAIATEKSTVGNIKPTSYQVAYGLIANNTQLDDRYYKSNYTNTNGFGQIIFDELKDFTEYNIYITAGNDIPYMPADLLSDDKVMQVSLRTLKNPNVGTIDQSSHLYSRYIESSQTRIGVFLWTTVLLFITALFA